MLEEHYLHATPGAMSARGSTRAGMKAEFDQQRVRRSSKARLARRTAALAVPVNVARRNDTRSIGHHQRANEAEKDRGHGLRQLRRAARRSRAMPSRALEKTSIIIGGA